MKKAIFSLSLFLITFFGFSQKIQVNNQKIRKITDTVGFAHLSWQMDSVMERIHRFQENKLEKAYKRGNVTEETLWKVAICPHDDYTYVGYLYPLTLYNVQAKTVLLFGVCHKAKQFGLENKLVFDSYQYWKGPYGNVKVSSLRDEILSELPTGIAVVNDTVHQTEHSLEALIPFLQYYNNEIEIIPILIPYMPVQKMDIFSELLAQSIKVVCSRHDLKWGKDFSFVISSDAVHYGDQAWGDKKYDWYGVDKKASDKAIEHETEIIENTLLGEIRADKLRRFCSYTVDDKNYKEYKWSWCGRYSVPVGLFTAFHLQKILGISLEGTFLGYSTSIEGKALPVDDLKMGVTAPAGLRHWVGYPSIGYQ